LARTPFQCLIDDYSHNPDDRPLADETPVEAAAEDALGDRRDNRRLRRGERGRLGSRRALEGESRVQQVEYRRDDQRAEDYAENQGNLLPPGCCVDQLTGLQILKVVVGDSGDAE